jgi:hypothetical protein
MKCSCCSPIGQRQSVEHFLIQLRHDQSVNPREEAALNTRGSPAWQAVLQQLASCASAFHQEARSAAGLEKARSALPKPGRFSPVGQGESVEHFMIQLRHDKCVNPREEAALNATGSPAWPAMFQQLSSTRETGDAPASLLQALTRFMVSD